MNFIDIKLFLEADEKVQKRIIDWWKPQLGDIYCDIDAYGPKNISIVSNNDKLIVIDLDKKCNYYIPLLTETQLRAFIEDTAKRKIKRIVYDSVWGYCFYFGPDYCLNVTYSIMEQNLLTAYWKLACAIGKTAEVEPSEVAK